MSFTNAELSNVFSWIVLFAAIVLLATYTAMGGFMIFIASCAISWVGFFLAYLILSFVRKEKPLTEATVADMAEKAMAEAASAW